MTNYVNNLQSGLSSYEFKQYFISAGINGNGAYDSSTDEVKNAFQQCSDSGLIDNVNWYNCFSCLGANTYGDNDGGYVAQCVACDGNASYKLSNEESGKNGMSTGTILLIVFLVLLVISALIYGFLMMRKRKPKFTTRRY